MPTTKTPKAPKAPKATKTFANPKNLGDEELLAQLLGEKVAAKVGGIANLAKMSPEQLTQMGCSEEVVSYILGGVELAKRAAKTEILGAVCNFPERIGNLLREWLALETQEHFAVLGLNNQMQVVVRQVIGIGGVSSVEVSPRDVFAAVMHREVRSVILVHNHPSGNTTPSQSDIELTRRMIDAGRILGFEVLDHFIVGTNGWTSLAQSGHM